MVSCTDKAFLPKLSLMLISVCEKISRVSRNQLRTEQRNPVRARTLNDHVSLPLVSVVIPAFNTSRFIEKSIDSVRKQTYRNLEIIVVDDGSSDDTADIVRRVMKEDSRVKLLQQENGGIASARNLAVKHSGGEFIAPLDADDMWLPCYLEKQVECMLKAPASVAVVYAWSRDIDEDDQLTGLFHASNIEGYVYETLLAHYFLANATSVLIRRSIFEKVGSYDSDFQRCEDWNLMARLARKYEFRVVKEFLVLYRKRRESMTQSYDAMALGQAMTLDAAQQSDSGIPAFIASISSSLFYGYLAQQARERWDVDSCLSWTMRSLQTNWLVSAIRLRTYTFLIWCAWIKVTRDKLVYRKPVEDSESQSAEDPKAIETSLMVEKTQGLAAPHSVDDTHSIGETQPLRGTRSIENSASFEKSRVEDRVGSSCSPEIHAAWSDQHTPPSLQQMPPPEYYDESPPQAHKVLVKLLLQDLLHLAIRLTCGIHFILRNKYRAGTSQILEKPSLKKSFTFADEASIESIISSDDQLPVLPRLPRQQSVSVIVPSCNRPEELRQGLNSLLAQNCERPVEIVVVDNAPDSGAALSVVSEFPSVKLVSEWRPGASFARNAGIAASTGDICVFMDDDIVAPPDWIERLIAPFTDESVGAVTGNVFPYELDSPTSKLFEGYANGGFNRGFSRWEADSQWFHSHRIGGAKTWLLGGSGNAAIRRNLLMSPEIGKFQTYLGAGVPAGSSEDSYLFYKIIKMGYSVAYEPTAYVWHKHRQNMKALGYQLFNYSKGFVSYHLTTLFRDGDLRSIPSLIHLPWWHIKRTILRIAGKSSHPVKLIMLEALGHLVGPFALIQGHWRARKLENLR